MPRSKIKIEVEPTGKRFFISEPKNCLKSIQEAGIGIKSVCGGDGTCGKCRIMFMNGSADEPNQ